MSALRAAHPVFRRRRFFSGSPVRKRGGDGLPDIAWFAPDGSEMSDEDWDSGFAKSIAVYLNGQGIPDLDERGQRVTDDSFVLCFNAHYEPHRLHLTRKEFGDGVASSDRHRCRPERRRRAQAGCGRRHGEGRRPGGRGVAGGLALAGHFSTSKNESPSSGVPSI